MFAEPAGPHHRPHFHAYYQGDVVVVAFDTIEVLGGCLPRRQSRMSHAIHRVTGFRIVGRYTLTVEFDDGVSRRIDFEPVLHGELFGPLRDRNLFDKVKIDPEIHTLVWPNGADFDPATLHDWPEVEEQIGSMARRWAKPNGGAG